MWRPILLLLLSACTPTTEKQVVARLIFESALPQILGTGPIDLEDHTAERVKTQAALLRDERFQRAALANVTATPEEVAAFRRALTVEPVKDSRVLEIVVHGEVPRAVVMCNQLLDEYLRRNAMDRTVRLLDTCRGRVLIRKRLGWWSW